MLKFDLNGHLHPYEAIEADLKVIENNFVTPFKNSKTRTLLFKSYLQFLADLKTLELSNYFQLLNGSFVTKKVNPKDIDLVTFINYKIYEKKEKELKELKVKYKALKIDCYFAKQYPDNHKYFIRYRTDFLYWNDLFTKSRAKQKKGYLKIDF